MKKWKSVVSASLATAMIITTPSVGNLPVVGDLASAVVVSADGTTTEVHKSTEGFLCELASDGTTAVITGFENYADLNLAGGELLIPEKVTVKLKDTDTDATSYYVSAVAANAFKPNSETDANKEIKSVKILAANNLTIGNNAFEGNTELANVTVVGTLATFGDDVFQNCKGTMDFDLTGLNAISISSKSLPNANGKNITISDALEPTFKKNGYVYYSVAGILKFETVNTTYTKNYDGNEIALPVGGVDAGGVITGIIKSGVNVKYAANKETPAEQITENYDSTKEDALLSNLGNFDFKWTTQTDGSGVLSENPKNAGTYYLKVDFKNTNYSVVSDANRVQYLPVEIKKVNYTVKVGKIADTTYGVAPTINVTTTGVNGEGSDGVTYTYKYYGSKLNDKQEAVIDEDKPIADITKAKASTLNNKGAYDDTKIDSNGLGGMYFVKVTAVAPKDGNYADTVSSDIVGFHIKRLDAGTANSFKTKPTVNNTKVGDEIVTPDQAAENQELVPTYTYGEPTYGEVNVDSVKFYKKDDVKFKKDGSVDIAALGEVNGEGEYPQVAGEYYMVVTVKGDPDAGYEDFAEAYPFTVSKKVFETGTDVKISEIKDSYVFEKETPIKFTVVEAGNAEQSGKPPVVTITDAAKNNTTLIAEDNKYTFTPSSVGTYTLTIKVESNDPTKYEDYVKTYTINVTKKQNEIDDSKIVVRDYWTYGGFKFKFDGKKLTDAISVPDGVTVSFYTRAEGVDVAKYADEDWVDEQVKAGAIKDYYGITGITKTDTSTITVAGAANFNAGDYVLVVRNNGDNNHEAATPVVKEFSVTKAKPQNHITIGDVEPDKSGVYNISYSSTMDVYDDLSIAGEADEYKGSDNPGKALISTDLLKADKGDNKQNIKFIYYDKVGAEVTSISAPGEYTIHAEFLDNLAINYEPLADVKLVVTAASTGAKITVKSAKDTTAKEVTTDIVEVDYDDTVELKINVDYTGSTFTEDDISKKPIVLHYYDENNKELLKDDGTPKIPVNAGTYKVIPVFKDEYKNLYQELSHFTLVINKIVNPYFDLDDAKGVRKKYELVKGADDKITPHVADETEYYTGNGFGWFNNIGNKKTLFDLNAKITYYSIPTTKDETTGNVKTTLPADLETDDEKLAWIKENASVVGTYTVEKKTDNNNDISYEDKITGDYPTNAGIYYAVVEMDNYLNTLIDYQIEQANNIITGVTFAADNWDYGNYNAKKNVPTVTAATTTFGADTAKYQFKSISDTLADGAYKDYQAEALTADQLKEELAKLPAGEYKLRAIIPETDNYKAVEPTVTEGKEAVDGDGNLIYDTPEHTVAFKVNRVSNAWVTAPDADNHMITIEYDENIKTAADLAKAINLKDYEAKYGTDPDNTTILKYCTLAKVDNNGSGSILGGAALDLEDANCKPKLSYDEATETYTISFVLEDGTVATEKTYTKKKFEDDFITDQTDNFNNKFKEQNTLDQGIYLLRVSVPETNNYSTLVSDSIVLVVNPTNDTYLVGENEEKVEKLEKLNLVYGSKLEDIPEIKVATGRPVTTTVYNEDGNEVTEFTKRGLYTVHVEVEDYEKYKGETKDGKPTENATLYAKYKNYEDMDADFVVEIKDGTLQFEETPTVADWAYNGESKTPSINAAVLDVNGKRLTSAKFIYEYGTSKDGEFTSKVPVDAGTYFLKVTASAENYSPISAVVEFHIIPATPTISVSIDGWTYGENASTPVVDTKADGAITYVYTNTVTGKTSTTAPTEVGEYTVVAKAADGKNYKAATSAPATFVIKKGTDTIDVSINGWKYGEKANAPEVKLGSGLTDYKVTYCDANGTELKGVPTDAGSYSVKVTTTNPNYETTSKSASFTIAKKDDVITVAANGYVYGENAILPTATAESGLQPKISYVIYDELNQKDGAELFEAPVNAGTYRVKATTEGNTNYNACVAESDPFKIAKAEDKITLSAEGWTYGEDHKTPEVSTVSGSKVNLVYVDAKGTESAEVPTEAGEYTIKAATVETKNYNAATAEAKFTIAKAEDTITIMIGNWTFGDENKTPTIRTTSGADYTLVYYDVNGNEIGSELSKNAAAGTYTVKATTVATNNYEVVSDSVTFTINPGEAPFDDVPKEDNWQYEYVSYVYSRGLMTGYSDEQFGPNDTLTREAFVQILYAVSGKPSVEITDTFDDVNDKDWFAKSVNWAVSKGISSGYSKTKFGVGDSISRQDMALMIYKFVKDKDSSLVGKDDALDKFADKALIAPYAEDALKWCVSNGLIAGKGDKLDPTSTATRAECAAVIKTMCQKFGF